MKVAICGDIHLSKTSSIVRSRGKKYTTKLENCITSLNWFEKTAQKHNCELEIFLGDVFDHSEVDDETLTAVSDIT